MPNTRPLYSLLLHFSCCCAAAALFAGFIAGKVAGLDEVTSSTYLVSSALCITAIACLSNQSSARTGNALGLIGVSGGVVATLGSLTAGPESFAQVVGTLAAGGLVGNQIASRIKITGAWVWLVCGRDGCLWGRSHSG